MKFKYIVIVLLISMSCAKEYLCDEFDMDNSLLKIALSPVSVDTMIFESNTGKQVKLWLNYANISDTYMEKCGGFSFKFECNCRSKFEQIYLGSPSGFYCGIGINEVQELEGNNKYCRYSFFSEKVFYNSEDIVSEPDIIEQFIDSIIYDTVFYEGNYYTEIFELSNEKTGSIYITKFWIKKDVGLYKFWKDNTCWSLIE